MSKLVSSEPIYLQPVAPAAKYPNNPDLEIRAKLNGIQVVPEDIHAISGLHEPGLKRKAVDESDRRKVKVQKVISSINDLKENGMKRPTDVGQVPRPSVLNQETIRRTLAFQSMPMLYQKISTAVPRPFVHYRPETYDTTPIPKLVPAAYFPQQRRKPQSPPPPYECQFPGALFRDLSRIIQQSNNNKRFNFHAFFSICYIPSVSPSHADALEKVVLQLRKKGLRLCVYRFLI